jgi:DNA-binding transcriptional regulator YhcF (GntR family)
MTYEAGRGRPGTEPDRAQPGAVAGTVIILDTGSPVPPYEQVRSQLATQIIDRRLAVGTRLPTVRRLAADLGLAANTVARSYRELEEAGLVETRGRAGTFVSAAGQHSREVVRDAARRYARTVRALGLDADEALRIVGAALGVRSM